MMYDLPEYLDIEEADKIYEDFSLKGYNRNRGNVRDENTWMVTIPVIKNFGLIKKSAGSYLLKTLSLPELNKILEGRLIFGDKEQIEVLRAWEFMDFCETYGY